MNIWIKWNPLDLEFAKMWIVLLQNTCTFLCVELSCVKYYHLLHLNTFTFIHFFFSEFKLTQMYPCVLYCISRSRIFDMSIKLFDIWCWIFNILWNPIQTNTTSIYLLCASRHCSSFVDFCKCLCGTIVQLEFAFFWHWYCMFAIKTVKKKKSCIYSIFIYTG